MVPISGDSHPALSTGLLRIYLLAKAAANGTFGGHGGFDLQQEKLTM